MIAKGCGQGLLRVAVLFGETDEPLVRRLAVPVREKDGHQPERVELRRGSPLALRILEARTTPSLLIAPDNPDACRSGARPRPS